ncbi:MAG: proteasome accessory factor PafA2 family protein [Verrucomicrobiae bacterium]|nr:proteasome accessory factor PafA2 family protein [Verrucomicrobiae bacterium]
MRACFGVETEYGITVEGKDKVDVIAESMAIVQSYTHPKEAELKWDYSLEDPYLDARGFRVEELLQDVDEEETIELHPALTWQQIKSDLVLSNGARFYNDHAHPEYSTPECTTIEELSAQDRAGEMVMREAAGRRNEQLAPLRVRLYKNNTDFLGHSYGCHDNYLLPRAVPFERLALGMMPFLVTRQIYAGAGKIGVENENHQVVKRGQYQISQRSDFFSVLMSIDTMRQRPIINTRDEPHATAGEHRRFHVIIGDSNMNNFATALKVGATQLALELIELDLHPKIRLADPIAALHAISHDATYRWLVKLEDGTTISALDLQRLYLEAAREHLKPRGERKTILAEWERVLDDLEKDPWRCLDRVDWVSKKFLLTTMVENEKVDWSDPWLESIDLEYHNLDLDQGLFYALERQGSVRSWADPAEVARAVHHPPKTTRAYFRGQCVRRFAPHMTSVQWDEVEFQDGEKKVRIGLEELFDPRRILRYNELVDQSVSLKDLLKGLERIA